MQEEFKSQKNTAPENFPGFVSGEQKRQGSTRYYIVLLIVLNIVIVAVYAFLFGYILHKKDLVLNSSDTLNGEQAREENLRVLKESFRNTEDKRAQLAHYFINSEEVVQLIEEFEKAGKHADVGLSFNYVNVREDEKNKKLVLEIESIGSFNELFYFLQMIEQVGARISLDRVIFDKEIPKTMTKRHESDTWHLITTIEVLSFDGD